MKSENEMNKIPESIEEFSKNACTLATIASLSAVLGFVAGIFCAPKAGKELRKNIEDKSHEFMDRTKEQINKISKTLKPELDKFGNRISAVAQ